MLNDWSAVCTGPSSVSPVSLLLVLQYLVAGLVLYLSVAFLLPSLAAWWTEEAPRAYTVAPAKLPEKYSTVEETSIRLSGSSAIQCYAPATGQFLGFVNPSSPASIDRSVALAAAAQPTWARTSFAQRRAVLRTLLAYVLDHQREICEAASLDSGKSIVDATMGEVLVTAERIRWTLAHGEESLRPERRPGGPLIMIHKRNEIHYEPLGVIAALVSWNYPFHNVMGPIISGLFAGNAVVVKGSERTAWSASYFVSIARGALAAHGHDSNLIQTVICWPATASHLIAHSSISHLTFIGSRDVAHKVAACAAKALTPLVAELGGKDPAIIMDSATKDIPRIVEILLRGTFQASGQNCIGIERIIPTTPAINDRLITLLEPRVRALRLGVDADVGAMISDDGFDRLENLIAAAVDDGARLLVGGKRHHHPTHPKGHYFQPTLLVDVTPAMAICQEECFAPIMLLCRPPATPTASAILAVANSPSFGLGASIYGHDADSTLRAVVAGLRVGMVAINDFAAFYAVQLPFGGVGGSGYGRFAGMEGLRGVCNAKSVCADRFGWAGVRTAIPPPVQYPIADQERSRQFTKSVVDFGYGVGVRAKLAGLLGIVKNS